MIKAIKGLLGLAQRTDATSAELAPSLPQAEAELAAAREALASAEAAYRVNLLSSDDAALRRLVEARTDAGVRVDRATALVDALRERLAAARDREAEAERTARYEAAKEQADAARAALMEFYGQFAGGLADLLRGVALAEIAVARANGDLPAGAAPIPGVEHSVRDDPGTPEEILSDEVVTIWCRPGDVRHDSVGQGYVRVGRDGSGYVQPSNGQIEHLVPRQFRVVRYVPAYAEQSPYPLGAELHLPGLRAGDPAFFARIDLKHESATPSRVLANLDRAANAPAHRSRAPEPKERHTLIGTYDLEAEREAPNGILARLAGRR